MQKYDHKIDASGLLCPLPLLKAKKKLSEMASDEVLYVLSTDPGSVSDFDAFCRQTKVAMLDKQHDQEGYHFYIKKD